MAPQIEVPLDEALNAGLLKTLSENMFSPSNFMDIDKHFHDESGVYSILVGNPFARDDLKEKEVKFRLWYF